jgi:hypothetical protein
LIEFAKSNGNNLVNRLANPNAPTENQTGMYPTTMLDRQLLTSIGVRDGRRGIIECVYPQLESNDALLHMRAAKYLRTLAMTFLGCETDNPLAKLILVDEARLGGYV